MAGNRWSTRRWIIVVALIAASLGAIIVAFNLKWRHIKLTENVSFQLLGVLSRHDPVFYPGGVLGKIFDSVDSWTPERVKKISALNWEHTRRKYPDFLWPMAHHDETLLIITRYHVSDEWKRDYADMELTGKLWGGEFAAPVIRLDYGNGYYSRVKGLSIASEFGSIDSPYFAATMLNFHGNAVPANIPEFDICVYQRERRSGALGNELARYTISNPLYREVIPIAADLVTTSPIVVDGISVTLEGLFNRFDVASGFAWNAVEPDLEFTTSSLLRLPDPAKSLDSSGAIAVWRVEDRVNPDSRWDVIATELSYGDPPIAIQMSDSSRRSQQRALSLFTEDPGIFNQPIRIQPHFVRTSGFPEDERTRVTFSMPPPGAEVTKRAEVRLWPGTVMQQVSWKYEPTFDTGISTVTPGTETEQLLEEWHLVLAPLYDSSMHGGRIQSIGVVIEGADGKQLEFVPLDTRLTSLDLNDIPWKDVLTAAGDDRAAFEGHTTVTWTLSNPRQISAGFEFIAIPQEVHGTQSPAKSP